MPQQIFYGKKIVKTLYQYDLQTGLPTGLIKDNDPEDPDYIPPSDSNDCPVKYLYTNYAKSGSFVKDNCQVGYSGSTVIYTVPEGRYRAETQEIADQLAVNDVQTNGPSYARINGTCTIVSLPFKWIPDEDTAYCEQKISEQTHFINFASPVIPFIRNNNILYLDRSLDKIIFINPLTLTQEDVPTINSGGIPIPSTVAGQQSRPTGWFYYPQKDYAYVQGDFTGGVRCIRVSDGTVIKDFPGGYNGQFQRSAIKYIKDLNQVWAIGNSIFLKIDLNTNNVVTTGLNLTGSITNIINTNGKIYVVRDYMNNYIDVYNAQTSAFVKTINNIATSLNPNGGYAIRGAYVDEVNNKLYLGEISSSPAITVIDTVNDTISYRINIPKEDKTYGATIVIAYNDIRKEIYVGGGIYNSSNGSDSNARLWVINGNTIGDTITPSANKEISDIMYYPENNSVYISSRGRVPQDAVNSGHESDGVIFKFS